MAAVNPQWPALRVSDADRDEAIKVLREGSADGRLSHETFIHRLELALQARYAGQLASLLNDLRPARRRTRLTGRAAAAWDGLTGELRAAWWTVRLPRLVLPRGGPGTVFTIGRAASSDLRLTGELRAAWWTVRLPRLVLPRGGAGTVFTIGRAAGSDLRLTDMTVSWRHAELRRTGDDWVLADLGSTNGTWANRWRVGSGLLVRAGDRVTFGQAEYRLCDPPSDR